MMLDLVTIISVYVAVVVVVFLHELGHVPQKIKFRFFPFPRAAAMSARYRLGGLAVNVALFTTVYLLKPETKLLFLIGLVAWVHFILYVIIGSIIPEPKKGSVNIETYVFDDVPNEHAILFIGLGVIAFIVMNDYYLEWLRLLLA